MTPFVDEDILKTDIFGNHHDLADIRDEKTEILNAF